MPRASPGDFESTAWKPGQDTFLLVRQRSIDCSALDSLSHRCLFYDFNDFGIGFDGVQKPHDHQCFHRQFLLCRGSFSFQLQYHSVCRLIA